MVILHCAYAESDCTGYCFLDDDENYHHYHVQQVSVAVLVPKGQGMMMLVENWPLHLYRLMNISHQMGCCSPAIRDYCCDGLYCYCCYDHRLCWMKMKVVELVYPLEKHC